MIPIPSLALAALVFFLCPLVGDAQEKNGKSAELPGDAAIDAYLRQETAKISERFLDGAKTREEWEARLPRLRREYLDMLGLWPLPAKTPLHATITGKQERDAFTVEMIHFQSKPGLYVTGNLYRPKKAAGRLPAILYVCGHSYRGRDGNKTAFQDHGMWFASHGYICLVVDTLQLGEIPGIHHGTYGVTEKKPLEVRMWWQALGYTPAGVECWNGIRAIDYLTSRPDVDPERIGVTGISGGGAATFWIAAADERVKCAVPVSGMSDLESYVSHKVINGHCDCMFLVNTYAWEWTTIAALVAPRPLLFCNSDQDPIFPMDGNRRIIARLRRLYGMYRRPELVDDYVSHGGHDYRPDLRVAVFKWINKHLKNDTGPVEDAKFVEFPGKELRVFPEDKDVPSDAINGRVDETFVARAEGTLPRREEFEKWKTEMLEQIVAKAFRNMPKEPLAEELRVSKTNLSEFHPEPNITVEVKPEYLAGNREDQPGIALIAGTNDDTSRSPTSRQPAGPLSYFDRAIKTRGLPPRNWTTLSPPNNVARAHALLGKTIDQGRVWDIVTILRTTMKNVPIFGEGFGPPINGHIKTWRLIGRHQEGVLAVYAALLEPSVNEVVVVDPPVSHREGPIFLNILRVCDIPDAFGLLAPRKLTIITDKPRAFERTAAIYRLAGAEKMLEIKGK